MRLLGLPSVLRKFGLEPVLVAGWETRGREMTTLLGSIDHHTAGARTGYLPSLGVLVNGRSDLPGPLCNVAAPRAADGDNKVYVIASGKANHAGAGFWKGADSNYELAGLERELVGDGSDLTSWRNEVACRVHAAFMTIAQKSGDNVALHLEYALPKGRKIDTRGFPGATLRARVNELLAGNPPAPPQGDELTPDEHKWLEEMYLRSIDAQKKINEIRAMFDSDKPVGEIRRNLRRIGTKVGAAGANDTTPFE